MKVEKGKYLAIISHGEGRHYLRGPGYDSLLDVSEMAVKHAEHLNKNKSPRAPKVKVAIARIVEVYDGGASGKSNT